MIKTYIHRVVFFILGCPLLSVNGQTPVYMISNVLSEDVFFIGIVNETKIIFNGIECENLTVESPNADIRYKEDCVWEIIPMDTGDMIFRLDFFISSVPIESIELLAIPPPNGELVLRGWKDLHFDNQPRIEFILDNREYNCYAWSRINVDELNSVLSFKVKSVEMAIEVSEEIVYRVKVNGGTELNEELKKQLREHRLGGKVILSNVLYEGSDLKERRIAKVEFKI